MATSRSSKDVTLTLSVETLGQENIDKLKQAVQQLAREGGDAAPEFQKLAEQIDKLGADSAVLRTFQQLAEQTDTLAKAQLDASTRVTELGDKLTEVRTTAERFATAQEQASDKLRESQKAVVDARGSLQSLRAEYDIAGKKTQEYRDKVTAAVDALTSSRKAVIDNKAALADANAEYSTAAGAVAKAETAFNRANTAADRTKAAFTESSAALRAAGTAAEELGISTNDVAGAQGNLLRSFNEVGAAAQQIKQRLDEATAAQARSTREAQEAVTARQALVRALNQEVQFIRESAQAQENATAAGQRAVEAKREEEAALRQATAAARAKIAADEEMAEHNRLFAIQQATRNDLLRRGADALFAERQALLEASQASNVYEAGKRRQIEADQQAAAAAEQAAKRIGDAFRTVGVRSVEELQAEINQTRAAMALLADRAQTTGQSLSGAFSAGQAKISALERDIRELNGTLTLGDRASKLFANSLGQIAAGNLIADAIGYLVQKIKDMGVAAVASIVQLDQMRRGLNAIYKDAGVTGTQIEFVRQTASRAGTAFGDLAKEFVKFSAAMTSSGVPLAESNALFASLTTAGASLGLTAEDVAGSLNALGQMASKGTVSMEELRQQLGDRLPGAFGLVANGLGITQAQLVKLVESGNLAARDLFPALTKALKTMHGETDGLVPTFERLKGLFTEVAQGIGDAGAYQVLIAALKILGGLAGSVALGISALIEAMALAGSAALALFGALKGDAGALDFFNEQVEKSVDRLASQARALNTALDPANEYGNAQEKAAAASEKMGRTAADTLSKVQSLDRAQQLAAVSTALAGDKALDASSKYVQFSVAAATLLQAQDKASEAAEKHAKAVATEGAALVELARIAGNETEIRKAALVAATNEAAARAAVATSRAAEVSIIEQQIAELEKSRLARGLDSEAIKQQQQDLEKKLVSAKAEQEQSDAAVDKVQAELRVRRLAVETYRDNSGAVKEYAEEVKKATAALQTIYQLQASGNATEKEVAAAKERLASAQRLYSDALEDSIGKIDRETAAKTVNLQASIQVANAAQTAAEINARVARSIGDNVTALYFEIEAKKQGIEVTRLNNEIKRLEAQAEIAALEIRKQEIKVTDELRKQKLDELDLRIKLQQIKLKEAGATDEVIRAMEREVTALRINGENKLNSSRNNDTDTNSRLRNADAIDKQTKALNDQDNRKNKTSDGFDKNADGSAKGTFNNNVPIDVAYAIAEKQRTGRLTSADAKDAQTALTQANNALAFFRSMLSVSPSSVSTSALQSAQALVNAAQSAVQRTAGLIQTEQQNTDRQTRTPSAPAPAPAPANGATYTIKLSPANSPTETVQVSNQQSADALLRALKNAGLSAQ